MTTNAPGRDRRWLIYGANGYTGTLIAEEARRRGHQPVLAGRNRDAVESLAQRLEAPAAVFGLDDPRRIREALAASTLLLHCAGPFSETSLPMLEACLDERVHYLDITGEIEVFSACFDRGSRAAEAGVLVAPGVGFDVVPTDGVAAMLKEALPEAQSLVLAFEAGGGPSVGTAKTSVQGLARGGRVRRDGRLVGVPLAYKTRTFIREGKPRTAMTIPWGDVFTAFVTTGIPDIEVYMSASKASIRSMKRLNWVRPLLRFKPLTRLVQSRLEARVKAPSAEKRAATGCYIWGEAASRDGRTERLELRTPNGYELTVTASLGVVERLLDKNASPPRPGYTTPSQLMGARYVLSLPGVAMQEAP